MSAPIKVIVADDHPLYRDGVVASLKESGMFEICGAGASAEAHASRRWDYSGRAGRGRLPAR